MRFSSLPAVRSLRPITRPCPLSTVGRLYNRMSSNQSSKLIFAPGENPSDAHQSGTGSAAQRAAQFSVGTLTRNQLDPNPFLQFHSWFNDPALKGTVPETVTLSTAELPSGRVSSRMVYLKELDEKGGFVIYSNWGTSRKAHDVQTNPHASLCFWWKPLERQVRIEGPCERLTSAESQVYYDTRARGSRIGAWASQQSSILKLQVQSNRTQTQSQDQDQKGSENEDDGRVELENQVRDVETRFEGQEDIPVPEFWGGLRVIPERVEFWQGRDSRLHDRFEYTRPSVEAKEWTIVRLSP